MPPKTFTLNDTFNIPTKYTRCDSVAGVCITLDTVMNDSRCPYGNTCIWEGNAEAGFTFKENGNTHTFILNTNSDSYFKKDTTINGYFIKMLALHPAARITPIPQSMYSADVVVKK